MNSSISFVIPVSNNEKTIERAIESVEPASALLVNSEIIAVLNNSQDKSQTILKKLQAKFPHLKIILSDPGRSRARNIGFKAASGDYVCFLDADDEINLNFISKAIGYLDTHISKDAVCASSSFMVDGTSRRWNINLSYIKVLFFKSRNPFAIQCVVFRRKSIQSGFVEGLKFCEDWMFWQDNFQPASFHLLRSEIGGIVHITGENTMKNISELVRYELLARIRCIQKGPIRTKIIPNFFDIKLLLRYFAVVDGDPSGGREHFPICSWIIQHLYRIDCLKFKVKKRVMTQNSYD